jgi:8-oxo-dGTP pyrophosphatase MutT (NUDIX family)
MNQMYRKTKTPMSIFIHHGPLSLEIQSSITDGITTQDLSALLEELKSAKSGLFACVESPTPEEFLRQSSHHFTWVEAAGGLIENWSGELLLIHRRGAWDLPKGKIDAGETPRLAANREIEEETGLTNLIWIEDLPPTFHIYPWGNNWVLKKTHWFRFRLNEPQPLVLQQEEDIEDAKWIKTDQLSQYWDQIYPSLRPLIRSAGY